MLFVLTGDIQTGKTRWLLALVDALVAAGAQAAGVVAPGVWKDWRGVAEIAADAEVDANGFEKLGIDNVLLPQGERISFAVRVDLAAQDGRRAEQSARAGLRWSIDEAAIGKVNDHFLHLEPPRDVSCLLVVDELGRLELEHGGGLTEALAVLERGPQADMRHALVVVREALLDKLAGRFPLWGEQVLLDPDERSRTRVLEAVCGEAAGRLEEKGQVAP